MEIHWVFTLQSSLLPLVCSRLVNFWNLANFFKLWAKKTYKLCKRSFSQCTIGTFNKVITMKFVLWMKQWIQVRKCATFSLNCKVTLDLWPWNTLFPSHLMLTSLPTSSSNFNPPYSTKHQRKDVIKCAWHTHYLYTKKDRNPFPLLYHIHVDKKPLGIIDCHNFIGKNNNERSKTKSCFGGI
jgi:hypothetical protein